MTRPSDCCDSDGGPVQWAIELTTMPVLVAAPVSVIRLNAPVTEGQWPRLVAPEERWPATFGDETYHNRYQRYLMLTICYICYLTLIVGGDVWLARCVVFPAGPAVDPHWYDPSWYIRLHLFSVDLTFPFVSFYICYPILLWFCCLYFVVLLLFVDVVTFVPVHLLCWFLLFIWVQLLIAFDFVTICYLVVYFVRCLIHFFVPTLLLFVYFVCYFVLVTPIGDRNDPWRRGGDDLLLSSDINCWNWLLMTDEITSGNYYWLTPNGIVDSDGYWLADCRPRNPEWNLQPHDYCRDDDSDDRDWRLFHDCWPVTPTPTTDSAPIVAVLLMLALAPGILFPPALLVLVCWQIW